MKPRILVSKCLEFDACRYDGQKITDKVIKQISNHIEFLPICPEVQIGMGIPREPICLVNENGAVRLKQPATKTDFTDKMNTFSNSFLTDLEDIDGFILKGRSPSCGINGLKVYPSMQKSPVAFKDAGLFAKQVNEIYPNHPKEEEGRLANQFIREHFLTSIYCLASFRALLDKPSPADLVDFHAKNKYLLMTYNQKLMREMGRLVSSQKKLGLESALEKYQRSLRLIFKKQPSKAANINTQMHVLGFFSEKLSPNEKAFFLDSLTNFRNGVKPLSVLNGLAWSWIVRFKEEYLRRQTYFQPFPEALLLPMDSAKRERTYKNV
ncbi:MAG: cytoplasmic protein [Candidatus Marinimicrobia bacterium]|nr:cytoplasmic protein [Candidatus Neomarinimicrobiota bacterium]|tara:strand:- start:26468 stop:27436 length:969 start_codon:yes stop_codon:yes gene_type:complete